VPNTIGRDPFCFRNALGPKNRLVLVSWKLGGCRRLLHHHDAEDAFQATFLVLVGMATNVPKQAVANWLYGVARQSAVRLRAMAAKRGRRGRLVGHQQAGQRNRRQQVGSRWSYVMPRACNSVQPSKAISNLIVVWFFMISGVIFAPDNQCH
jgi:hypothetical protein